MTPEQIRTFSVSIETANAYELEWIMGYLDSTYINPAQGLRSLAHTRLQQICEHAIVSRGYYYTDTIGANGHTSYTHQCSKCNKIIDGPKDRHHPNAVKTLYRGEDF